MEGRHDDEEDEPGGAQRRRTQEGKEYDGIPEGSGGVRRRRPWRRRERSFRSGGVGGRGGGRHERRGRRGGRGQKEGTGNPRNPKGGSRSPDCLVEDAQVRGEAEDASSPAPASCAATIAALVCLVVLFVAVTSFASAVTVFAVRRFRDGGDANAGRGERVPGAGDTPAATAAPSPQKVETTPRFDDLASCLMHSDRVANALSASATSSPKDYLESALADPASPQYRALSWLANNEDERQYQMKEMDGTSSSLPSCETRFFLQRYALATFFYAVRGDELWEICGHSKVSKRSKMQTLLCTPSHNYWFSPSHVCTWSNIRCGREAHPNDDGRDEDEQVVNQMNFAGGTSREQQGNMLDGELPGEMSLLSGVRYFVVGDGMRLRGSLWDKISTWSNLDVLLVSRNRLEDDAFPNSVADRHPRLSTVHLGRNQLHGTVPAALEKLSDTMIDLQIHGNNVVGTIPVELASLSELTILKLNENQLSGEIPAEFFSRRGRHPRGLNERVEILYANDSPMLIGTMPTGIDSAMALRRLRLGGTGMTGAAPFGELLSLQNLEELNLRNASFTGTLPNDFVNVTATIRQLILADNDFYGAVPESLSHFPALEELNIQGNTRLTGTLSNEICDHRGYLMGQVRSLTVDCDVGCDCCNKWTDCPAVAPPP